MLIINADDFGKNKKTTNRICECFSRGRVTSATAMMFMSDSENAARIALRHNLGIGLHLNFSSSFTMMDLETDLIVKHERIVRYFTWHKYIRLFYNPFITGDVKQCFKSQYNEFLRLYGKEPTHIDGHHYLHLCANVVFGNVIPDGIKIRRSITYPDKTKNLKKNIMKRFVWSFFDKEILKKHLSTNYFFELDSNFQLDELRIVIERAKESNVELVHGG